MLCFPTPATGEMMYRKARGKEALEVKHFNGFGEN